MNCIRLLPCIALFLLPCLAAAQEPVHNTLEKRPYPKSSNRYTITYTEEDYRLFLPDSLAEAYRQDNRVPHKDTITTAPGRPPKEKHPSEKAAATFYLKEY